MELLPCSTIVSRHRVNGTQWEGFQILKGDEEANKTLGKLLTRIIDFNPPVISVCVLSQKLFDNRMHLITIAISALLTSTSCSPLAGNCIAQGGCLGGLVLNDAPVPLSHPLPTLVAAPVSALDAQAEEGWRIPPHYAMPSSTLL